MADNPQPENIPPFATPQNVEKVPARKGPPSKFDSLPKEILQEVDTRLLAGEKIKRVRQDMIQKYPSIEELKASYETWQKHTRKVKGITPEVKEGIVVKKELVATLPTTEDLKNAISTVVNPQISLDKKQEAMASLFDKATARLAVLEARQRNFLDPDIEALMLAYMKEQKSLIEKVTELQEVLNKDVISQFRSELNEYTRTILSVVYSSYKIEHPDSNPTSKFDSFRAGLESHLLTTLQAYNQNTPKN